MATIVDITATIVLGILRAALLELMPRSVQTGEVIRAQANRVPEPAAADFVIMTPLWRRRLATNIDTYEDIVLQASFAGSTMTVNSVTGGTILAGSAVIGPNLALNTWITGQTSGTPGGAGTYTISPPQTLAQQECYAGLLHARASTEVVTQLDVHGPSASEWVQAITTMLRDEWGTLYFKRAGLDGVVPLHCSEARQTAFLNAESQYEDRWTTEVSLQANPTISILQQFFVSATATLVQADDP